LSFQKSTAEQNLRSAQWRNRWPGLEQRPWTHKGLYRFRSPGPENANGLHHKYWQNASSQQGTTRIAGQWAGVK